MTRTVSSKGKARAAREKKTLAAMVNLYCRRNHVGNVHVCEDCRGIIAYACARIDSCPFIEDKPTCLNCKVHCYDGSMRERTRSVMRYSGPRMIYRHPVLAVRHLIDGRKKHSEEV